MDSFSDQSGVDNLVMMYYADVYIGGVINMVRTQIYLTEWERAALNALSAETGKKQSELIREAIDEFIAKLSQSRRDMVLDRVAGIWKGRDDLPDFTELRKSWDRDLAS